MPSRAAEIPAEHECLCQACGYSLYSLPPDARCPECGATEQVPRVPPDWERHDLTGPARLFRTTRAVLLAPDKFFQRLPTRSPRDGSLVFCTLHLWFSSYLLGLAVAGHLMVQIGTSSGSAAATFAVIAVGSALSMPLAILVAFVRWMVAILTGVEARYFGWRLPRNAIRRALDYHAATLTPTALGAAAIVATYHVLLMNDPSRARHETLYTYALSAYVVLAGLYLFWSYWQAMKNIRYANT
jgi:hypothetical protein